MLTIRVVAAVGMIVGLFIVFGIKVSDLSGNIFGKITGGPKGIRDEILEETSKKKKSYFRREIEETESILENTGRADRFPFLCTLALILFACGAVTAALIGNFFMIPALAIGMMFIPFWYVKLTASHFKKNLSEEVEMALQMVTSSYIRNEDIVLSVKDNVGHMNPPVLKPFREFYNTCTMVDPDVNKALDELKGKIKNDVFEEWVDAMKACQFDRSLKTTLVPIVQKLADMRVVNAELEYMVSAPRKEFITMVVLVISNVPLMYFLNKDWYDALMHTIPGQIMLAICVAAIFISASFVIRLTKPIEYRN